MKIVYVHVEDETSALARTRPLPEENLKDKGHNKKSGSEQNQTAIIKKDHKMPGNRYF